MNPTISIIIAVKNEEDNLPALFESIKSQTYKDFETIVVDNYSTDKTKEISQQFTDSFYEIGPERSSQRNYGATVSKGEYVLMLDADMTLQSNLLEVCISKITQGKFGGLIIDEEGIGKGFWGKCRKLEKSFYLGSLEINAARFYEKKVYLETGGYDNTLISGEDWDLSQRVSEVSKIGVAPNTLIYHAITGDGLVKTIKKKFYYGSHIDKYSSKKNNTKSSSKQMSPIYRYMIYLKRPGKLFKNPVVGLGMLFLKTVEFGSIALGYFYFIFRIKIPRCLQRLK